MVQSEYAMRVSVREAGAQLTELVRRTEAGDEVILTRHGHATVRLVPVKAATNRNSRRTLLEAVRASGPPRPGNTVDKEHSITIIHSRRRRDVGLQRRCGDN